MITEKICSKCTDKTPKLLSAFALNKYSPDGHRTVCKQCCNEYSKNYKKNPPPKRQQLTREEYRLKNLQWSQRNRRKNKLKRFYNLTEEEYQAMFETYSNDA